MGPPGERGSSAASGEVGAGPVYALAIDPATPTTLYAGTVGDGVFQSLDGGSSWNAVSTGLSAVVCGDGFAACGEQCDDGGESATCDADCTLPQCGDGTLNVAAGEQCDDGNRNPFDGCMSDCTACGNGIVTAPEECDDGNTASGDDCDAQCRLPRVVGTGTPESCTEAAFEAVLAERSVIFNCGPEPVTITLTSTSEKAITAGTTIDGGGRITLSGGGAVRTFAVDAGAALDVRNLTIADGHTDYNGEWPSGQGGGIFNAGTLTVCANAPVNGVDQRGYAPPGSGHTQCSIGAYEADGTPPEPTPTPSPSATPTATEGPPCTGDCNHDDHVAINELIVGVNIALGRQPLATCPEFDRDTNDGVEITELVTAVSNALNGCGG